MNRIRASKFVDFRWSALALIAMVSVITLSGTLASSASEAGASSGMAKIASTGASTGSATEVKIDNFAFSPGEVTVKAGTQVSWINHDDVPHTVDSTQGKFKSAALDTDDKFQFLFTEPGEYPFYCRMHPRMTGKIIVQP
jgi:plastocyanin